MMKMINRATRKDLLELLDANDYGDDGRTLAEDLKAAGPYTEATEDEIERFMDLD